MAVIRWAGFAGENRAIHPSLLKDSVGVVSRNQKPGRGDLRPWGSPVQVATVPLGRETIYRMGRDVASDADYWLSWPTVVHAVRGFDAADTTERTFYTGDGAPKVTDNTVALASAPYPTANRPLGIPAPAAALLAVQDVGSWTGDNVSTLYTYTFVNDWGWESAPAPASALLTKPADATVTLSSFSAAPAGNYQITAIRIYKAVTGAASGTEFFFLREIAYGTTSTSDDGRDIGEALPSADWLPPPNDLSYLTSLWNGMLAGLSGNSVRFCEPYVPYAWPIAYDVVPPDSKPVALGVFGQSLLVLTTGRPLLAAGSGPDAMDQQPVEFSQACAAPRSVVSMGVGVAWASEDGLCWFGQGGARLLTSGLLTREDWQAMQPTSVIGCMYEGLYFGSYHDGSGRKGFFIDPTDPSGIYFLDTGYSALHFDSIQDQLYVLDGVQVKRWDGGTAMTVTAKSKLFRAPKPINFACAEVVADSYPVTFKIYAGGAVKLTHSVSDRNPFRLPSGFMDKDWQIEIVTQRPVQSVAIATSVEELSQV